MFLKFLILITTFCICFMIGYVIALIEKHFEKQRRSSYEKRHPLISHRKHNNDNKIE